MQRLKYPKSILFFNTLTLADAGAYVDSKAGRAILSFKKDGINIPGAPDLTAVGGTLDSHLKVSKSYTDDGYYVSKLVKVVAPARAEDIYYPYALTIRTKIKVPGVRSMHTNVFEKTYGGDLPVVTTTSGYVDDAFKLIMENNLLDYITDDVDMHNQNDDPTTKFAGAIVEAFRVYEFNVAAEDCSGNNAVFTITWEDGTTTTCTMDQATQEANINAVNADLVTASKDSNVICVGASDTKFYFVGLEAGEKWTGAGTGTGFSSSQRYIRLVSKYEEVKFDVEFEPAFATQANWGLLKFGYSASANFYITLNNGTKTTVASGANAAATVAAIEAAALTGVWASKLVTAGTDVYVTLASTVKTIAIDPTTALTFSNATNTLAATGEGRYPSLTRDEVFRKVFNKRDQGALSAMVYLTQPVTGDWAKYTIEATFDDNEHHAPSQKAYYQGRVEIYMPKSVAQTNVWDVSESLYADTATTPDTTFEGLLGLWSDLAVTSW